jgi:hypothetical protein
VRCIGSERAPPSRSTNGTHGSGICTRADLARGSSQTSDTSRACPLPPLNPVRSGLCDAPGDWPWSSYAPRRAYENGPDFWTRGSSSPARIARRICSLGRGWSVRDIPGRARRSFAGTTAPDHLLCDD